MPVIIAHRGFSSRHPEMTRGAYRAAIAWAAEAGIELGLECDVHFSADRQLICLHDLTVDRTAGVEGRAIDLTVEQLKRLDFSGRGFGRRPPVDRELVTLAELIAMVRKARQAGTPVTLVIETKHPNPLGGAVEERVAEMLAEAGWDVAGSPVRLITFSEPAIDRLTLLLPELDRTFLIELDLGSWSNGELPDAVRTVGPDLNLIKADPGFVARSRARGHEVHVWTVNEPADIRFCRELGVTGFTTDYPDRVAAELAHSGAFCSGPPIA